VLATTMRLFGAVVGLTEGPRDEGTGSVEVGTCKKAIQFQVDNHSEMGIS
jgi:hypothetical protein